MSAISPHSKRERIRSSNVSISFGGMGRCQAGFCSPRTMEILEREVPMSIFDITKNGVGSNIVVGYNKEV